MGAVAVSHRGCSCKPRLAAPRTSVELRRRVEALARQLEKVGRRRLTAATPTAAVS